MRSVCSKPTFRWEDEHRFSAIDKLKHTRECRVTVTLDNTPPVAELTAPLDGSRLIKRITITGEVSDEHLASYALEYTTETNADTDLWRQILKKIRPFEAQEGEVRINHPWEVPTTITGLILIRLTAIDAAGNTDLQIVSVEVPQALTRERGGEVNSSDGHVSLNIPPRSLPSEGIIIAVNHMSDEDIAGLFDPQMRPIGRVYNIEPEDLVLLKPSTLTMSLTEDDIQGVSNPGELAIFTSSVMDSTWKRVGGTLHEGTGGIAVALTRLGRFAVMEDLSPEEGKRSISDVHCQPRVFSPRGGGYDITTTISFHLGKRSAVTVKVYDSSGRFQRKVVEEQAMNHGSNAVV